MCDQKIWKRLIRWGGRRALAGKKEEGAEGSAGRKGKTYPGATVGDDEYDELGPRGRLAASLLAEEAEGKRGLKRFSRSSRNRGRPRFLCWTSMQQSSLPFMRQRVQGR